MKTAAKKKVPIKKLKGKENPIKKLKSKDLMEKHWKGMPEFNQPGIKPVKVLTVNFESNEAMHKFSKLVGQLITAKTRSIWYPKVVEESALDKRWSKKK